MSQTEAQRRHVRKWQRKRAELICQIKLESGCVDCGYAEHPHALEFDHVRGEKKFAIGSGHCRGAEALMAEIEKCEVVCANCHRVRTHNRRYERAST